MANDIEDIGSTLNNLIETLKDGEDGFRTSAEKVKDASLSAEFRSFTAQRIRFASELQSEVTRLGGEPKTSGSASGALHRGWIDLKAAFTGNDDYAILAEAERGEDAAVKNYREALATDLPIDIRTLVENQYRDIVAAHNTVRTLRDAAKAAEKTAASPRTYG